MDNNICYNCNSSDNELQRLQKKLKCIHECCQNSCNPDCCCEMYEKVYPELTEYLKTHKEYCHSFGNVPQAFDLPEGHFEMLGSGSNTLVLSYKQTKPIVSDGVTLRMEPDETVPRIFLGDSVITGIYAMLVLSKMGESYCWDNIFRFTYGLYEAESGSSEFELIRESQISFEPLYIPPQPEGILERAATGLDIHTSKDKDYVFAVHHSTDMSPDTWCRILTLCKGNYYAW